MMEWDEKIDIKTSFSCLKTSAAAREVKDSGVCGDAYIPCQVIQRMEAFIVGFPIQAPRCKNQQVSRSAGIEAALDRFPVLGNLLFLQDDERKMTREGGSDNALFSFRNAWSN